MLQRIAAMINLSEDEVRFHAHLLINAFDQQHRVLFWNHQCELYFGITEEEALGKRLEELVPSTRNNKKMAYLQQALSGLPVYLADNKYDRKNGFYDQVLLPVKDNNGNVLVAVNIVVDLTGIKLKKPLKFSFLNDRVV